MKNLVKKAQKGDKGAFIELLKPLEKKLYVIAKSKLDNEMDIEDAIQETILSCYKNIKSLKENDKFDAWIISILINNCNLYYKSKKNIVQVSIDEGVEIMDNENHYEIVNKNIDFFKYVELLNEEDRELFILYYSDDCNTKEIADTLNMNENTVKTRLRRCRQRIQEFIERGE